MNQKRENPFLWPMLRTLPYFRALLRAVEADFYGEFELAAPVLDLGCGDGLFASQVFKRPIDVGIASAFSNSVLEHIPGLQAVLNETARVLRPGGLFLFCVPNHRWQSALSV